MARIRNTPGLQTTQRLSLSAGMREALDILRMSNRELAEFLEAAAARVPGLEVAPLAGTVGRAGASVSRGGRVPARGSAELAVPQAEPAGALPGLYAHVMAWIERRIPASDRAVACAFAEALEPSGWLGSDLATISAAAGVPVRRGAAVLTLLQRIEPAGLFARDLAECLRLQAEDAGLLDPAMSAVLDRLDLVARQDLAEIARRSGLPVDALAAAVRVLRGFDPKPGARFAPDAVPLGPPELIAQPGPEGWIAAINPDGLMGLRVRPGAGGGASAEAARISAMIARRNATLQAIAAEILARQGVALDHGRGRLLPLTRRAVAETLGLSPSTVSRAIEGARIVTPLGVMRLADFFPAALSGDTSSAAAQSLLRRLVAEEDRHLPLTDAQLARALADAGIPVSRRTVVKYRDRLGIAPRHLRRRS
ncbi:MAG: RNA polymerase sigma-54 factor [Gemmobacter sp.]